MEEGISLLMEQGFGKIQGFQVFNSCSLPLKEICSPIGDGEDLKHSKCFLALSILFFVEGIFMS